MTFKQGYALIIGVGDCVEPRLGKAVPKHDGAALTTADARGVAAALLNPKAGAFPRGRVTLLTDAQATRANILNALDALTQVNNQDTVLVLFAGPGGLNEEGEYTLATRDAKLVSNHLKRGTGLDAPTLFKCLSRIRAQHLLLILNTHFSANPAAPRAKTKPKPFGSSPPAAFRRRFLGTGPGRAMLSATLGAQFSNFDPALPTTFFGQALIDALNGQIQSGGETIGLEALYTAVCRKVIPSAASLKRNQTPVLTIADGAEGFAVALNRGGQAQQQQQQQEQVIDNVIERIPISRSIPGGILFDLELGHVTGAVRHGGGKKGGVKVWVAEKAGHNFKSPEEYRGGDYQKTPIKIGHALEAIKEEMAGGTDALTEGDTTTVGDVSDSTGVAVGTGATANVHIDKQINIYSSANASNANTSTRAALVPEHLIAEPIRLDVASPAQVLVGETFTVGVAVRQPDSPPLQIQDLPQVTSEEGEIFRAEDTEIINYRVELDAPDFVVSNPSILFRLKKNENSRVKYFTLRAKKAGKLPVLVKAYQEQYEIASARLTLEAVIRVMARGNE